MAKPNAGAVAIVRVAACLTLLAGAAGAAPGQSVTRSRKPAQAFELRSLSSDGGAAAADRVELRGGGELLGQINEPVAKGFLSVIARRDWLRVNLPDRAAAWESAGEAAAGAAARQRRDRLVAWRRVRPAAPAAGDRITSWLDRRLSGADRFPSSSPLIVVKLARDDVVAVDRRGAAAARALRYAWLLGLGEPEATPLATLADSIASRGVVLGGDAPVAVDRLLPPSSEFESRWLLRRAATEALNDEGLRYVRFGNNVLPEPAAGRPPDPAAGAALVAGTIRDVLGVGGADPLPERLREVAGRGRVGAVVTTVEVTADLGGVSAESALYYRAPGGWARGPWGSGRLEVGAVPTVVAAAVARDPQVKALRELVEAVGGGLVSAEMKERGLAVGVTAGGAVLLARASLFGSLGGLAFEVDGVAPGPAARPTP